MITDLGSLGGNQNQALSINNRGQIVELSQTTIPDPFSLCDFLIRLRVTGTNDATASVIYGQVYLLTHVANGRDDDQRIALIHQGLGEMPFSSITSILNPDDGQAVSHLQRGKRRFASSAFQ